MANWNAPTMGVHGSTWQYGGYSGAGNVEALLGSLTGRAAVVAGNAEGVFDELTAAFGLVDNPVVFGVNDVGMYLDRMDHWVSLHTVNMEAWKNVRWLHQKGQEDVQYHSTHPGPVVNHVWELLTPAFALSGYFAMQIAYMMGCHPIVLCGCPGSPRRRFFERMSRKDFGYGGGDQGSDKGVHEQIVKEMHRLPEFRAKVRSMSGWTKEFFGGL